MQVCVCGGGGGGGGRGDWGEEGWCALCFFVRTVDSYWKSDQRKHQGKQFANLRTAMSSL